MKSRIVFADGVTGQLREVQEHLRELAPSWELSTVRGGLEALTFLAQTPCDAIVTDLELRDMTGLQLATQVMRQYPQMHRLILADLGDLESLLRCVGTVHQFLAKPCEASRLQVVLHRAFALDVWLPNQAVRQLLGRMPQLPSPADIYSAVVAELQRDPVSLDTVAALIAGDPPMAAKVLQLANAVAYGPPLDEADPVQAVKELGLANTRAMLLLAHSYSSYREIDGQGFSIAALWEHSRRIRRIAREIARVEDLGPEQRELAATAGLVHDIGKIALAANLTPQFHQALDLARTRDLALWEAEQEVFGATHDEVGGCLLGIWGLPLPVVEAVAMHHHPTRFLSDSFSPLTAVHVASALEKALTLEEFRKQVDRAYLGELGLEPRVDLWWERCRPQREPEAARA
jgi:putative nucleotidyltransferase with HDIG domain